MKTPRSYQLQSIQSCVNRNTLIADEPGLGKTLQGILGAHYFMLKWSDQFSDLPSLFICKKRKVDDWIEEIEDLTPLEPTIVLEKPPAAPIRSRVNVVTHYEAIANSREKWIKSGLWSSVVLDEAHYIRDRNSKRTIAIKAIKTRRKIALTGTPADGSATETWSILNWLYPQQFRSYQWFFDNFANYRIVYTKHGRLEKPLPGTRDPHGFSELIKPFTFQRTKKQVAPWLPQKIINKQMINLAGPQQRLYNLVEASDDIEAQIGPGDDNYIWLPNELAKITKLQQITSDPAIIGSGVESTKLEWLYDYIKDNPLANIVIFTRFAPTALKIARTINAPAICQDSRDTPKPFVKGEVRCIVGTIDAMAESFNFQRGDVSIFVDMHWSSIKMGQAIERTDRMDSEGQKYIIYLVARGTVDEVIFDAFNGKWAEQRIIQAYIEHRRKYGLKTQS